MEPLPNLKNKDIFSMNIGGTYKVVQDFYQLKKGSLIVFNQVLGETVDKGTYREHFMFTDENGRLFGIPTSSLPKSMKESYHIFEDVLIDLPSGVTNRTKDIAKALQDRSPFIRESAARRIDSQSEELQYIYPIILKLALETNSENLFCKVFYTLGENAKTFLESEIAENMSHEHRNHHLILSKLGSDKYLETYYRALYSQDSRLVCRYISYLENIGLSESIPYLEPMKLHKNYNVRFAAKRALDRISTC